MREISKVRSELGSGKTSAASSSSKAANLRNSFFRPLRHGARQLAVEIVKKQKEFAVAELVALEHQRIWGDRSRIDWRQS